jgi:hypothetical protein
MTLIFLQDKEAQERETTLEESDIKMESESEAEIPSLKVEAAATAAEISVPEPASAVSVPDATAASVLETAPGSVPGAAVDSVPALEEIKIEVGAHPSQSGALEAEIKVESPVKVEIKAEPVDSATETKKETEEKEIAEGEQGLIKAEGETEIKTETAEGVKEEEKEGEVEGGSANNSLILDAEMGSQATVLQPQQKVSSCTAINLRDTCV